MENAGAESPGFPFKDFLQREVYKTQIEVIREELEPAVSLFEKN